MIDIKYFIMEESKQHVQVPDPDVKKHSSLKPIDYLVYANIRRYMNKDTKTCYPSLETISKDCDCSIPTVRSSIKRLASEQLFDIINSKTSSAHTLGVNQLGGVLSHKINEIRENLLSLTSHLQALLDFPEEGLEPFGEDEYYDILKNTEKNISQLIETSDKGRIIRDGI